MLARDRELDMETDRDVVLRVVFFGDFNDTPPQRRSSTHSLSQSLSHTHTHTHRCGQVVPDFSGFANIFDHMWSARVF